MYVVVFFEFFKIGLFAVGGGAVTIPFLFDLSDNFNWFSKQELVDMIAVSQATPGPIGVNMATYVGFKTLGVMGGIISTFGLVLPSFLIVILISKLFKKYINTPLWNNVMGMIRPVVVALILSVVAELMMLSVGNYKEILFAIGLGVMIYFYKKSPIFYILLSGILGGVLGI